MDQKQKALLILKVLFESSGEETTQEYIQEKIDACFDLPNPAVLLGQKEKTKYMGLVEEYRKEGKVI